MPGNAEEDRGTDGAGVAAQRCGDVASAVETQDGDGEVAQAGHGPRALAAGAWGESRRCRYTLEQTPRGGDPLTVTAAITQGLAVAAIPAAVVAWAIFRGIRAWR